MAGFISKKDEGVFLKLFIRDGFVLNFTTNEFDIFTNNSIGVSVCAKYHMSKGKSLVQYLSTASDEDRTKLLADLFSYYERNMEYEYNKDYKDDSWGGSCGYNDSFAAIYQQCKAIMDGVTGISAVVKATADELKNKFSSEYLSKQIDLMLSMQSTNPTEAIGKSKELIESCCKTILEDKGILLDKNDDVPALTHKVLDALSLLPSNVNSSDPCSRTIKSILGSLRTIPSKLAELRNSYGSGHGKSASFVELEERHAKLAVGCSIAFVDFVWSTYESMRKEKKGSILQGAKVRAVPNEAGGTTLIIE